MKHEINVQEPTPVQDWENRAVNGAAIACKKVYEDKREKVEELRARQEAYEKSLPTDPAEGLQEINRLLVVGTEVDGPLYAPRAALDIIQELAVKGSLDDSQQMNNAVFWLTCQALDGLTSIETGAQRSRDIARQFHPTHQPYKA